MEQPPVWLWYRVYAVFMGLFYGGIVLVLAVLLVATGGQGMNDEDLIAFVFTGLFCVPFALAYLAAPFLPRAPWAWIYHIVLIGLGLTSVCCMPVTIPLLVYWLKPENKLFFGRTD